MIVLKAKDGVIKEIDYALASWRAQAATGKNKSSRAEAAGAVKALEALKQTIRNPGLVIWSDDEWARHEKRLAKIRTEQASA